MRNITTIALSAILLSGCVQGTKSEMGPEDTVRNFYETLCAGEFAQAESLCNTLSMKGYLDAVRSAWDVTGDSVMKIASDILSETSVTVTDMEKNGQGRTIFYELTCAEGTSKEKIATLRKEGGAWKIEQITDRN